VSAE
jgi:hypothetical protein